MTTTERVKIMKTNELKPMKILWGRLKGAEEWQEDILSTIPENFDKVKVMAAKDGYGHFRESIDYGDVPDFSKTVRLL